MKSPQKTDWIVTISLIVITLSLRVPIRSRYLFHWDSVNFALSLQEYDINLHQPHPPGYFLYSMLGRLVNLVIIDANASLVWISLFSGVLGVVAVYWLGLVMFNRDVGLFASLLVLTSPLFWFYNEVALSYSLEFFFVTIIAGLCYLQLNKHRRYYWVSAILLAIAGGIRQNDLVFLLPLWLISLIGLSWKQRLISLSILGSGVIAWMIPMIYLSGGVANYLAAVRSASAVIVSESPSSSLDELLLNIFRFSIYICYGLLLSIIPLLWGLFWIVRRYKNYLWDKRIWIFSLWIGPAALFYVFVHIRQHGHIFTFFPALILLAGWSTIKLKQYWTGIEKFKSASFLLMPLIIGVNIVFFLFAPPYLLGVNRLPLQTPSRQTIAQRDQYLQLRIEYITSHFDPTKTIILAGGLNFRHPDYYLAEFQGTSLSYQLGDKFISIPETIDTLVLFDESVLPQLDSNIELEQVSLSNGQNIQYISWDHNKQVFLNRFSLALIPKE